MRTGIRWTDGVDVVVSGLVSLDTDTRSNISKEREGPSEGQVKRNVAFSDRCSKRTFEGNSVLLYAVDGWGGYGGLSIDQCWCDIDLLPYDRSFCGFEDRLDALSNLGTDTCRSSIPVFSLQLLAHHLPVSR